jgi:uncharacterized membrane protein
MSAKISIYIGAILTLLVAFYHTRVYKKLEWAQEFYKMDETKIKAIYTVNTALAILFGIIGLISILYAGELSRPDGLAFGFCIAYSCFWIWRLVWQFTYQVNVYDINPDHIEPVKIIFPSAIAISYVYPVFLKIVF